MVYILLCSLLSYTGLEMPMSFMGNYQHNLENFVIMHEGNVGFQHFIKDSKIRR